MSSSKTAGVGGRTLRYLFPAAILSLTAAPPRHTSCSNAAAMPIDYPSVDNALPLRESCPVPSMRRKLEVSAMAIAGLDVPAGLKAHRLTQLLVALSFSVLLLAPACGGQEHNEPVPPDLAEALRGTSEFQRERLQDGKLTYEEYESAVLATVQCLRDRGVVISVEPRRASGNLLQFAWASTAETDAAGWPAYESCYREHQALIDLLWSQQNQPSEETVQRARAALADCLREAGEDLPENPASADFRRLAIAGHPAVFACQHKITTEFDLVESFFG